MAPKEPTRAQLSSRLAYQSHTPNFLLKFKNRMNGVTDDDGEAEGYNDDEFEYVGGGREPIPRRPRPPIPERPEDAPGSEEDDHDDEKPQVVVLKAGKHLSEREAENIRRAEKGLPPLPDHVDAEPAVKSTTSESSVKPAEPSTGSKNSSSKGLSFSSSSNFKSGKRKAAGQLDELKFPDADAEARRIEGKTTSSKNPTKKRRKEKKTLLSFGDDA